MDEVIDWSTFYKHRRLHASPCCISPMRFEANSHGERMTSAPALHAILRTSAVMPVIVIDDPDHAVALARALVAGGIRVLELTLRTPAALESVRRIRAEVPQAIAGVGTIVTPADLDAAREAGAQFGVSPGCPDPLLAHACARDWPFLPGVLTPTDVMRVLAAGLDAMKLFPAQPAGGVGLLKALHGPFPQAVFCPTGGIDARNAADFLALPNVACVGGSWLAPASLIARRDWAAIEALARQAASLQGSRP